MLVLLEVKLEHSTGSGLSCLIASCTVVPFLSEQFGLDFQVSVLAKVSSSSNTWGSALGPSELEPSI